MKVRQGANRRASDGQRCDAATASATAGLCPRGDNVLYLFWPTGQPAGSDPRALSPAPPCAVFMHDCVRLAGCCHGRHPGRALQVLQEAAQAARGGVPVAYRPRLYLPAPPRPRLRDPTFVPNATGRPSAEAASARSDCRFPIGFREIVRRASGTPPK